MAYSAGILEQSMGARNQVGMGLSYRLVRQHRLAESIPGLLKNLKLGPYILYVLVQLNMPSDNLALCGNTRIFKYKKCR
jgi:hypothetical protein